MYELDADTLIDPNGQVILNLTDNARLLSVHTADGDIKLKFLVDKSTIKELNPLLKTAEELTIAINGVVNITQTPVGINARQVLGILHYRSGGQQGADGVEILLDEGSIRCQSYRSLEFTLDGLKLGDLSLV